MVALGFGETMMSEGRKSAAPRRARLAKLGKAEETRAKWRAAATMDLSGYHRDALGEACLVAFSYAQTKGLGWALIGFGAASRARKSPYPMVKAIWQGYQRGKAAEWLLGQDYEALMAEPLEAARRRLNISPATVYDAVPAEARDGALPLTA